MISIPISFLPSLYIKSGLSNFWISPAFTPNRLNNWNNELNSLISSIKSIQKKYVRSEYDSKYKEELDKLNKQLNEIPIYVIYQNNLDVINQKINYIKDTLNDYFYHLFN